MRPQLDHKRGSAGAWDAPEDTTASEKIDATRMTLMAENYGRARCAAELNRRAELT